MVVDQVERRAAAGAEHREVHLRDLAAVAHRAVGDEARGAAHFQPGGEDLAAGGDALLAARVDDQHAAGRDALDRLALRVLGIVERAQLVDVLARRDVADGERLTHQVAARGLGQAVDPLQVDVAQAALEHLGAERRGADAAQALECLGFQCHAWCLLLE
jgi:hypothetical protein